VAYQIILTIACVVLSIQYVLDRSASPRGKGLVGGLTVLSFCLPTTWGVPWQVVVILLQVSVCLFILLRRVALRAS
jgi:hypothetical protein